MSMTKQTVCPNCGGWLRAESHGWICQKCKGFISLQDGKFYEYVEKPFMPPMTNADRIRAMSDEELAIFLEYFGCCHYCSEHERLSDNRWFSDERCDEKCAEHCLEWLKQPAEEKAQPDCTYNKNGHCIGQKLMPECDAKNCDRRK